MTPARWALITDVFHAAAEKPTGERSAFLQQACSGDELLRRDVERMLAAKEESIFDSPLPELLQTGALDFDRGTVLGDYLLQEKIGEGGMGAIYRGYDKRLHRTVALKVLSPECFADRERKRRLLREAQAASSLNHPNIVTIYAVGSEQDVDYIAMEYVEGTTLDRAIPAEGLPAKDVVAYAIQIADAVGAAHARAILHRDLKPSNIMVTPAGQIKLLDFGLAKVLQTEGRDSTGPLTEEGAIMGTAAYMSPEQARGSALDARSDVFSFGVVLYEMATGRKPFAAGSRFDLLNQIVSKDPELPSRIAPLRPELEVIILRCLPKDPSRRYQTMEDLKVSLQDVKSGPAYASNGFFQRIPLRKVALFATVLGLAAAGTLIATRSLRYKAAESRPHTVKFTITPANLVRSGADGEIDAEVSISRDGKHIAYVESPAGQLWIRDLDREEARPVQGANGVYQVFWSPDNQSIGYSAGRACGIRPGCDLVRIPIKGGTPRRITRLSGSFKRASWSSDGRTILFCDSTGMYSVPVDGGLASRIVEHPHIEHPSFVDLPGGRQALLFQAFDSEHPDHAIYIQVDGENRRRLIRTSTSINPYPAYSPTGHIVYVDGRRDETAIWALPFSLERLEATGPPFLIARHGASPAVSMAGTLVYSDVPSGRKQLLLVDRSGATVVTIGEPHGQSGPALSPDGRQLAVEVAENDPGLWIYDLARGNTSRLTSGNKAEISGSWTPRGDRFTYASARNGNFDLFSKAVNGGGRESLLVGTPLPEMAPNWSPDERYLLYSTVSPETKFDLLYRERTGDGSLGEAVAFLKTPFVETAAQFSPDGRFVVYVSDESGRNEVYVRDFPKGSRKWQVSTQSGIAPRWRRDGREILYVEQTRLMAVPVAPGNVPVFGVPARLFERASLRSVSAGGVNLNPQYDISADGCRLVILDRPAGEPPLSIHVIHNWFQEFRSQDPGK